MGSSPQSTIAFLRATIEESFSSDIEFESFCIDHFPDIKKRFGSTQEHLQKVNLLLEIVDHDLIRNAIVSHRDSFSRGLPDGLRSDSKSKKKNHNNRLSLTYMALLILIFCAILGGFFLYKNLMAIRLTGDLEFTVGRPSQLPSSGVTVGPNDFAGSIERMVIGKLGPENTIIRAHMEFDVQTKTWVRHIEVIEKKTNKTVLFTMIPEYQVQAWVSSLPITRPFAREIIVEAIRVVDSANKRRLDEITLAAQLQPPVVAESFKRAKQSTKQKQFTQPTMPAEDSGFSSDKAILATSTPPNMVQPDTVSDSSSIGLASPRVVPEILLAKEFINKPIAMLSGDSQMRSMCARFIVSHKVCVGQDGLVTSVTPIRSAAFFDREITGVLETWKLKPRSEPICFIKSTTYEVTRDKKCNNIVDLELPDWQPELANIHERIIPLILAEKSKSSSNDNPTLPDLAKAGLRGYRISGAYNVCVSLGGVVYKTEPTISINKLRGLAGIDEHIMSKLRSWIFRPWPVPTCFIQEFTFEII